MYMNYYIYILFLPMFIISNLIILISNSWISMWMIMELSMLSMLMMMMFDKLIKIELLMKYFMFQTLNSYLFLFNTINMNYYNMMNMSLIIMNISMLMKLSIMPFHYWYLKIMMNLNWMNIYIFSVLNKIIPLFIINNIMNIMNFNMYLNYILMMLSMNFSSILGINQMNMKLLMCYSSMIQLCWLIIMMNLNELIMSIYFMIYNYISLIIYMFLYKFNINYIYNFNFFKLKNINLLMIMMMMFMSLSGIPPFMGFLMKWINIQLLILMKIKFIYILIYIINSLISLYFYFRIMFNMMMNYYIINKNIFKMLNLNINLNFKLMFFNWTLFMLLMLYQIM